MENMRNINNVEVIYLTSYRLLIS